MKILSTADLQLQNFREFSSINEFGFDSRAYNLLEGISLTIDKEMENGGLDALVISGDVFDNRVTLDVPIIELAHNFFYDWSKKVRVIIDAGNHDQFMMDGSITSIGQFRSYCTVITKPTVLTIGGIPVAFSPFRETKELIEKDLEFLHGKSAILYGHWSVNGVVLNGGHILDHCVDVKCKWLTGYQHVILGDIHQSQTLGNITYMGSPCQHDFGERGDEKFVWVLEESNPNPGASSIKRSELILRPIKTHFPVFVEVSTLAEAESCRKKGYYVNFRAKSREDTKQAVSLGLRVTNDWKESIAGADRPIITNLEQAVRLYADSKSRPDLTDLGLSFVKDLNQQRSTPCHSVEMLSFEANEFFQYPRLSIDLSKKHGLVIVNGVVEGVPMKDSNGAGKTTPYEGMFYALYGQTLRFKTQKDKTIRKGSTENSVKLTFKVGSEPDTIFTIERKRPDGLDFYKTTGKTKKDLNGARESETQKAIDKLVGSPEFFLRVSLLAIHQSTFLSLGDADKKQFIDKACGLDFIDQALIKLNSTIQLHDIDVNTKQSSVNQLDVQMEMIQINIDTTQEAINSFEATEDKNLQNRNKRINAIEEELKLLNDEAEESVSDLELKAMQKELSDLSTSLNEAQTIYRTEKAPLISEKTKAQSSIDNGFSEGDQCETCGYTFTGEEDSVQLVKHSKERIAQLDTRLEALRAEYEPVIREAMNKQAELISQYATEDDKINKVKLSNKKIEIKNTQTQAKRASLNQEKETLTATKRTSADGFQKKLNEARELLTTKEAERTKVKEELLKLESKSGEFGFWRDGFGSKGCKSLMYTGLLDSLNSHLQDICNHISAGTFGLRLLPYTEGKEKNQEKMALEVLNAAGCDSYEGDSTGERGSIDLAVNMALRKVLFESTGYRLNFIFIDEPFQGIDFSSKMAIYKFLKLESEVTPTVMVTDQDIRSKGAIAGAVNWMVTKRKGEDGRFQSVMEMC